MFRFNPVGCTLTLNFGFVSTRFTRMLFWSRKSSNSTNSIYDTAHDTLGTSLTIVDSCGRTRVWFHTLSASSVLGTLISQFVPTSVCVLLPVHRTIIAMRVVAQHSRDGKIRSGRTGSAVASAVNS